MNKQQLLLIIPLILISCLEKRTYLTDEIKNVVSYKQGQKLTFVSNSGLTNTLFITVIEDGRFPEGIGAPNNERLHVVAFRQSRTTKFGTEEHIFSLSAKQDETEESIHFEVSLKDMAMNGYSMTLTEFNNLETQVLKMEHQRFDDVIRFVVPPKARQFDRTIREVYWSKSAGYVKLVQNDGTIWNLTKIEYR